MKAATVIYTAVAVSASLSVATLIAFAWSERRSRERDREQAQRLASVRVLSPCPPGTSPIGADEAGRTLIPIQHRPFPEALWEDEPDLAPSPQARAIARELIGRQRNEMGSERAVRAPEPLPPPSRGHSATERTPVVAEAYAHEENDEMLKRQMAVAALTVGALTACQSAKRPEYQHNPLPRERYEITMTIKDAPGPLKNMGGVVQYNIENWLDCMPEKFDFEIGHHREQPEEFLPLTVVQVAENVYRAEIVADALQNEDYHGLGVCRWEVMAVTARLLGRTVRFTPRLFLEELQAQQPKTIYFSKRAYYSEELEGTPYSGNTQRSYFGREVQDELFTITLAPRRIRP